MYQSEFQSAVRKFTCFLEDKLCKNKAICTTLDKSVNFNIGNAFVLRNMTLF